MMAKLLTGLHGLLQKQAWTAEAIAKVAAPDENTLVRAWPKLRVIELAALALEREMREAREDFARIIAEVAP
jgi:hypothetical protein